MVMISLNKISIPAIPSMFILLSIFRNLYLVFQSYRYKKKLNVFHLSDTISIRCDDEVIICLCSKLFHNAQIFDKETPYM